MGLALEPCHTGMTHMLLETLALSMSYELGQDSALFREGAQWRQRAALDKWPHLFSVFSSRLCFLLIYDLGHV